MCVNRDWDEQNTEKIQIHFLIYTEKGSHQANSILYSINMQLLTVIAILAILNGVLISIVLLADNLIA